MVLMVFDGFFHLPKRRFLMVLGALGSASFATISSFGGCFGERTQTATCNLAPGKSGSQLLS